MSKANILEKAKEESAAFEKQVQDLTLDRMNQAPKLESEPQTKLSSKEIENSKKIVLKPERWIADHQKFNSEFEKDWEFDKEYVQFVAEHKELQGESIEIWTHPFGGKGAEFWRVPTNTPVWGPRYLAEQIRKCKYHRLRMDQNITATSTVGMMYGGMVVDFTVERLTAEPVASGRRSVFIGMAA